MTPRSSDSENTQIEREHHRKNSLPSDLEKQKPPSSQHDTEHDPNIVAWDKDDKHNPFNWPSWIKVWITFQLGMLAMAGSLASSIISPANEIIADYIGVSKEVGVLSVSLYM